MDEEFEIFGQRVNAANAALLGVTFRISELGPASNAAYDAYVPDVAYSPVGNEYWVTWSGDDNIGGMVDEEFEIFLQRILATGAETGPTDYRLSAMGPDGSAAYDANQPQLACSTQLNQCVIAWHADHNTNGQLDEEYEIFIERVGGPTPDSLTTHGQRRISLMGGLGDAALEAFEAHIAYNPLNDDYLVVWHGTGMVNLFTQTEAFAQRIDGEFADQVGDEVAISDMGPDSVNTLTAQSSAVAFNSAGFEYFVAWQGDDNIAPLVNDELEIFGQRLGAADVFEILLPLIIK